MTAATATFGRNEYAAIGRLLISKKPEIAKELILNYLPSEEPTQTDFKKISLFFIHFCQLRNLTTSQLTGAVFSNSKTQSRRVFIACILKLYAPHLFTSSTIKTFRHAETKTPKNFINEIAFVLQYDKSNLSRMIKQVVTWYNSYSDFASEVELLIKQLQEAT